MNNESNSKQIFKITLTCQSAQPLIFPLGVQKETEKKTLELLQGYLASMRPDYGDLPVIQMEVEEVSP